MTPEIEVIVDVSVKVPEDDSHDHSHSAVPPIDTMVSWAQGALEGSGSALCIRVVDRHEMLSMNREFAHKDYATNVLSFPMTETELIPAMEADASLKIHDTTLDALAGISLGDIAICADVVNEEASVQGKTQFAHWAHMVVHGVLHLRGYDHQQEIQAETMEQKEREILALLGFSDPYEITECMTLTSGNPAYGG